MTARAAVTRRAAAAATTLAALLALSGCSLTGTIVIAGPNRVDVDLTYTPDPSDDLVRNGVAGCLLDSTTVTTLDFTRQLDPSGASVCRVTGFATTAELQRYFGLVRAVGDRYQVEFFPAGRVPDAVAAYTLARFETLDVSVTFPGTVEEHLGGQVAGTTIRWTDEAEFVRNRGLAASGMNRIGRAPLEGVAWLAGGAALVVGLAVGAWAGLRVGRRHLRHVIAGHRETVHELNRLRAVHPQEADPAASAASDSAPQPGDDDWSHD